LIKYLKNFEGNFLTPMKGEVGVISAMELREIRAKTEKGL